MIYKSFIIEKNISAISENLVLIYGENIGIKNEIKKEIKKKFKEFEILLFNQEEILKDSTLLFNEVNNISLFEKGKIILDGQEINKVSLKSLRNKISLVSQDVILFDDTVENNIKYANLDAKDSQIKDRRCFLTPGRPI